MRRQRILCRAHGARQRRAARQCLFFP
jgi:hypothetical protein